MLRRAANIRTRRGVGLRSPPWGAAVPTQFDRGGHRGGVDRGDPALAGTRSPSRGRRACRRAAVLTCLRASWCSVPILVGRTSVGSLVATLVSGLALGGAVIVMIVSGALELSGPASGVSADVRNTRDDGQQTHRGKRRTELSPEPHCHSHVRRDGDVPLAPPGLPVRHAVEHRAVRPDDGADPRGGRDQDGTGGLQARNRAIASCCIGWAVPL